MKSWINLMFLNYNFIKTWMSGIVFEIPFKAINWINGVFWINWINGIFWIKILTKIKTG